MQTTRQNFDYRSTDMKASTINNLRNKSVRASNAQTSALCGGHGQLDKKISSIVTRIEQLKNVSLVLYYIAYLQLSSGLRISEVLDIAPYHISRSGLIKIKSKKGSQERVIHAGLATEYLIQCKANNVFPFQDYDRFFVYRQYKKLGIESVFGDNKKSSVTHIFRHLHVLEMKSIDTDFITRQKQLGHKSSKSTQYYEQENIK